MGPLICFQDACFSIPRRSFGNVLAASRFQTPPHMQKKNWMHVFRCQDAHLETCWLRRVSKLPPYASKLHVFRYQDAHLETCWLRRVSKLLPICKKKNGCMFFDAK